MSGSLYHSAIAPSPAGIELWDTTGADPYLDFLSRAGMRLLLFEVGPDSSARDRGALPTSTVMAYATFSGRAVCQSRIAARQLRPRARFHRDSGREASRCPSVPRYSMMPTAAKDIPENRLMNH
jgi:hypothetical protein